MNKWRLTTLWILGFTTFMTILNLVYAVFKGTMVGGNTFYPFVVGNLIGAVTGIQYFWISAILAGFSTGVTLLVAFPPFSLAGGRLSRLQPFFDTDEYADDGYVLEDKAPNPLHETLQSMQASTAATAEANAAITKNLLMDYQLFRSEMQASLKRQENFNQLLTLLTLSTLFDRNSPQSVIRPVLPSLAALNQSLPASWELDPMEDDAVLTSIDHKSENDGVEITEEELRTLIQGPVRVKVPKERRVFHRAKPQKRGNRVVVY